MLHIKGKIIASLIYCMLIFCFTTLANTPIQVAFNGELLEFDTPPVNIEGRILVPMRSIFERFGAVIEWDQEAQTARTMSGNITIEIQNGKNTAFVNNREILLDISAQIINGRMYVPLRFISESFGADVTWDSTSQMAHISLPETRGNTPGNIVNHDFIVKQDQWLYASLYRGNGLWKINELIGEKQKIFSDTVENMNLIGDWIYCTRTSDSTHNIYKNMGLYRIKIDGSMVEKLWDEFPVSDISVIDHWIYFINANTNIPFRMDLNGSAVQKLSDVGLDNMTVTNGMIYGINDHIYKMTLTGSSSKYFEKGSYNIGCLLVDSEWIYFTTEGTQWEDASFQSISRVRKDGTHEEKIVGDWASSMNIDHNYLYYTTVNEPGIFKIKVDGTEKQKLSQDTPLFINIIDNMLYYQGSDNILYKLLNDGSQKVKLLDPYDS